MSQEKLSVKKLKEILRLKYACSMSHRAIARAVCTSASTVSYYVRAFKASGLRWQVASTMDERDLIEHMSPHCIQIKNKSFKKTPPDYREIHTALKRKGVTKQLLWQEYVQRCGSSSYSYTEYCRQYRQWYKGLRPSLRQHYKAGEKCFVDYAGPTVSVMHPNTGEVRQAMIFVGVLGASNYTYAEATWSRSRQDWLGSHSRMFSYFGGVTELVIPDNEKSGVQSACYYDPEINPHYAQWAKHYQTVILPTRPYHPRDKAKVETGVQVVERWILARLRHRQFFSLRELNEAIAVLLKELNHKPFKKQAGTRHSQFEALEKPALKSLPETPYEYADIKTLKVRLDYHIYLQKHYYSVPYQYLSQRVECRISAHTVEIYHHGIRIASHVRSDQKGMYSTHPEHMPEAHRQHQQWTPAQFIHWAQLLGEGVKQVADYTVGHQPHPERCYRIHLGMKNLVKRYGEKRFEQACLYAISIDAPWYRSIRSILKNHLDSVSVDKPESLSNLPGLTHINIRGATYYQTFYLKKGEHLC